MKTSMLLLASAFAAFAVNAEDPYIESLGTSGISTGYRMKGGISRVEVDFQLTTTENSHQWRIFGDTSQEKTLGTMFYYTGTTGVGVGHTFRVRGTPNFQSMDATKNGDSQWSAGEFKNANLNRYTLVTDLKNGENQIIGGSVTNSLSFNASLFNGLVADLPLSLFANFGNTNATAFANSSKAKIYGVKIYENDALVHDFVPCLKDGETPCFKDLVGGGFIIGENVAVFRAGGDNVPTYQDDGYLSTVSATPGEYLYIDTGYQVKDSTRVELDCALASNMVPDAAWILFDARSSNSTRFQMGYIYGSENPRFVLHYAAKGVANAKFDTTAFPKPIDDKDVRRTFILDIPESAASVVTSGFTNRTVTLTGTSSYAGDNNSLKIACAYGATWAIESSSLAPMKIYGCRIYESGVLVHDLVPYVRRDYATGTETAGLLDSKTGNFVSGNAKSDSTAGVAASLPYGGAIKGEQDAYIESNGSTGMSSGYKMKGNISRVEVEYSLTDANANSTRIFGDTSKETTVKTMFYFTGSAGQTGGLYTYRISAKTGSVHDVQYHSNGVSTIPMDTNRRTLVTDLKSGKCQVITGGEVKSSNFANYSSFATDFNGLVADLPLSLFANYVNAAGTTYDNSSNARIYSVRFYENYVEGGNNTPVRELIPYKKGDVVGFYDTVTGEIVKNDNAASGAFTFGGAGTDHGALNCYLAPGYATTVMYGGTSPTLTAYAPGAVSYKWLRDGLLIDDDNDGVPDGADGVLPVTWMRGGTKTTGGYSHAYQAVAVFNLYGVDRESGPTAAATVTSLFAGTVLIFK